MFFSLGSNNFLHVFINILDYVDFLGHQDLSNLGKIIYLGPRFLSFSINDKKIHSTEFVGMSRIHAA